MSSPGGRTVLVLGGIGSGRRRYAESLLAGTAEVRRITAGEGEDGADPARLAQLLAEAKPDETLLVDGLDRWLPPTSDERAVTTLAAAVGDCAARLVLVSPEVGQALPDPDVRAAVEVIGEVNRAVAEVAAEVVLVVAGQPVRLREPGAARTPAPTVVEPDTSGGSMPESLSWLPQPDQDLLDRTVDRLAGTGLGALAAAVSFAAATQGNGTPAPWRTARAVVLRADHAGAACAGATGADRRVAELREGTGPLAHLAGQAGVQLQVVELAAAAAIEDGPAMSLADAGEALAAGWRLAEQAADEGVDLLVLAALGDGADTAAAAVTAALGGTAAEPATLLARVRAADGTIDDAAWIRRCAAVRDAVYRTRSSARSDARAALAELGGADTATAAGLILGAAARRTPVALDGPVGVAGALAARQLAAGSRRWCLLPDHGGHPTVVRAAALLGLAPLLDLKLALTEGATTLAVLPLLRSALVLAGTGPG